MTEGKVETGSNVTLALELKYCTGKKHMAFTGNDRKFETSANKISERG